MKSILLSALLFLSLTITIQAQCVCIVNTAGTKTVVSGPVISMGALQNSCTLLTPDPYDLKSSPYDANDTVVFKGETEIILGEGVYSAAPTNIFDTYSCTTNVAADFHAYLSPPKSYDDLKKTLDAGYSVTVENILYFRYEEKYSNISAALDYQIYDYQRNKMVTSFTLAAPKMGMNYYEIDIGALTSINSKDLDLEKNQYYTLEVKNAKGEVWMLRFKYIPME